MTGPLVLPDDIEIIPLTALSASVRARVNGADDDYAVTRPRSRHPSKVIDAQAAAFLRQFEKPTTLVEAIRRHSQAAERAPQQVLEEVYPFLESCLLAKLLVEPGGEAQTIRASFRVGGVVAEYRIEECIQVLADSELYRVRSGERQAALKIARLEAGGGIARNLEREETVLKLLDGRIAPRYFASGQTEDGRRYLLSDWIAGELCTTAATGMRMSSREPLPWTLLSFCGQILDAYAALHRCGIVHSDVHPGNLLRVAEGEVRIIDYGLSRIDIAEGELAIAPRGGVGFYLEPEYAAAVLSNSVLPQSSFLGEQYSVAALIYHLLTGQHCLNFSFEKEVLLRQIAEQPPVPLAARGLCGTAALDRVLLRALSKDPSARFPDMAAMAAAYWGAVLGSYSPSGKEMSCPAATVSSVDALEREGYLNSVLDSLSDPEIALPGSAARSPTSALVSGSVSIAYGLWRIACAREDAELFSLAARWLDRAEREISDNTASQRLGTGIEPATQESNCSARAGLAWVCALMSHSAGDLRSRDAATDGFLHLCNQIRKNPDADRNASLLLAASFLLDALQWDATSHHENLVNLGNLLRSQLWDRLDAMPPIAKRETETGDGMTRGWAGDLYATLQWTRATACRVPAGLDTRLRQLADQSRWLESRQHRDLEFAPQFEPGADFVFLWTLAYRVFGDPRWLRMAEVAGRRVASPREGCAQCHTLTERAYNQLNLYKCTGDRFWLDNAIVVANAAMRQARGIASHASESPVSHQPRELGLAVLIADLVHPHCAVMPFVEDEGWPAAPV